MGNRSSKRTSKDYKNQQVVQKVQGPAIQQVTKNYNLINDNFTSYNELEHGLRKVGLESCQLIVGVDFTKSNTWNGGSPYYIDVNLHSTAHFPNPYQQVLSIMCQTLAPFDDDGIIPAYGFGDHRTKDKSVFPFLFDNNGRDMHCIKLDGIYNAYNRIIQDFANGILQMSGPTTFAPLIYKAIDLVKNVREYHILLIICDGQVDNITETTNAIVEASKHPLSIVCIGVGKGPWDKMETFDDDIPTRDFDNFQFVNFHEIMNGLYENKEIEFAKRALMEIPDQYEYIKKNILMK
ncbi:VWA copine [Fadolivirus algeromassiliense]|jgi:hypothetical protein|uniref:VWA copine n=1 Tax=Fadolivirus FV1/VV64 TaxID=3070911 RepID=A0A7D3V8P3_9VIRU|nr:VWA copine [Fadolivirus algeromassiliense]QKF93857.1 VWA copine [Fadolivirus FV1/VV64]